MMLKVNGVLQLAGADVDILKGRRIAVRKARTKKFRPCPPKQPRSRAKGSRKAGFDIFDVFL